MNINQKWNEFIEGYRDKTLRHLASHYSMLPDEDRENIFMESLKILYENILKGKVSDLLYPYFLKICINLSLKEIERQTKHPIVGINNTDIMQKNSVSQRSVEQILQVCQEQEKADSEKAKLVRSILDSMSPQCKELLWSFYAEDLNWATIAGLTGLANANSAKSSASRCRQTFKDKYIHLKSRIYDRQQRTHR